MKQIFIFLVLFLLIQTIQAQPMVVQEQKLNNGEIVRMCVLIMAVMAIVHLKMNTRLLMLTKIQNNRLRYRSLIQE